MDERTKEIRYAVKWEGYSMEEMSWEPLNHFYNNTDKCVR